MGKEIKPEENLSPTAQERESSYCYNCVHYMQHPHPFYHDEHMEACLSAPDVIGNYILKKVRFKLPSEKNANNACLEYKARFGLRFKKFISKFFK